MTIILDKVSLKYPSSNKYTETKYLFKDISLEFRDGEFTCLLGPSGCGKSSILGLSAGFIKSNQGEVLSNNKPITRPEINRTLVFQEYALFPWLNVIDNVAFGLKYQIADKYERYMLAARYLKLVGLLNQARNSIASLSGGMKQRVALARALVVKPEVLMMDEPFGALDDQTRRQMQVELVRIWRELNYSEDRKQTVLFVTHSVDEALLLADRVVVFGQSTNPEALTDIKADIQIRIERPRMLSSSEMNNYRNLLLEALFDKRSMVGFDAGI